MHGWPTEPFPATRSGAAGAPRVRLRTAVEDGSVRHVLRGVYVAASTPDTIETRAACAAAALTPNHVVVDRTAAWIYGIDAYALPELDQPPPIEAFALRGTAPSKRADVRAGERDLGPADVRRIGILNVTTPLRTAMDLGCRLRRREAYAVLNEFARLHGLTIADYRAAMPRFGRRRGVIQLRELIQLVDPRIESPRESWVRLALHQANLPEPTPQLTVHVEGEEYRLDFAYAGSKTAIEYDGEEHHTSPEDRRRDTTRRDALRRAGWQIIIVRNGDFTGDRLDAWLRTLREALIPSYTSLRGLPGASVATTAG